jgi:hypothetical protein
MKFTVAELLACFTSTLRLSYTNQSVNAVQWNNRRLFWDPHKTHTLCGQNVEYVNVKRGGTYSNHWALGVYI